MCYTREKNATNFSNVKKIIDCKKHRLNFVFMKWLISSNFKYVQNQDSTCGHRVCKREIEHISTYFDVPSVNHLLDLFAYFQTLTEPLPQIPVVLTSSVHGEQLVAACFSVPAPPSPVILNQISRHHFSLVCISKRYRFESTPA